MLSNAVALEFKAIKWKSRFSFMYQATLTKPPTSLSFAKSTLNLKEYSDGYSFDSQTHTHIVGAKWCTIVGEKLSFFTLGERAHCIVH